MSCPPRRHSQKFLDALVFLLRGPSKKCVCSEEAVFAFLECLARASWIRVIGADQPMPWQVTVRGHVKVFVQCHPCRPS